MLAETSKPREKRDYQASIGCFSIITFVDLKGEIERVKEAERIHKGNMNLFI
jgi:hypothetical protein